MIETINLTAFNPLVQMYAADAPWPIVSAALRRSAIEFCERTKCWRATLPMDITRQDEAILLPIYATVDEIEAARFNGDTDLAPIPYVESSKWPSVGHPRFITQQNADTVRILPFEAGSLELDVLLKPIEGHAFAPVPGSGYPQDQHDVVPKLLYTGHAEAIAAGALKRVLIVPGQTYSNPDLAAYFGSVFEAAANNHFADCVTGQQQAPIRSKPSFM